MFQFRGGSNLFVNKLWVLKIACNLSVIVTSSTMGNVCNFAIDLSNKTIKKKLYH